ncbi:MAG: hypothetical protein CBC78_004350 [Candidatus Pelagibacter sp. TMED118]|nr:MAG: hypothetical protein CBC78_004350 [Candidatus Pelagibacter sp. TMED118]|tara:strand:+ start:2566 stop:2814 length:249 start_codon:yes stop_codon:yes gene_type:complete
MDKILKIFEDIKNADYSKKQKIYLTASISWIIFIGYLTWWNGMKSISLDKSFRWDEWFWFGIVPATVPYIFYFIWKDKDDNQ